MRLLKNYNRLIDMYAITATTQPSGEWSMLGRETAPNPVPMVTSISIRHTTAIEHP